jgi:TPR repeat protein
MKARTPAAASGMLPRDTTRPPRFAYAVSLYKADLLFRSLVDLSVSGFVILTVTGGLGNIAEPITKALSAVSYVTTTPASVIRVGSSAQFTSREDSPGLETILGMQPPEISDAVIERATSGTAPVLSEARRLLESREPEAALAALSNGDADDPAIQFGKAVATLHLGGGGRAVEAQRHLRGATQKAFAPAFTLNGLVLYRLLALHESGDLPAAERVSLDGAGRPVGASPEQLAGEAVQWWQRGAAFHDAEAMRMLGMAQARGFTGKRDLTAAATYWRDAAARGDALARFELAKLYHVGVGVEADSDKAIELFRQASDQGVWRASTFLGVALMPRSINGDVEATREAIDVLTRVARDAPDLGARIAAHLTLGFYFSDAAPPNLRDPARSVDHFRFAARVGERGALKALGRAFENGVGVDRDLVKAAGYLTLLQAKDPAAAEPDLTRISKQLTAAERNRVNAFRQTDDPASPDFRKVFNNSSFFGLEPTLKPIESKLKRSAP